jgi:hypothetical protein
MFIPLWLFYLLSGTIMAVVTLVWAVRNRQFEEQDRARFIPLAGLTPAELGAPDPPVARAGRIGIAIVVAIGCLALLCSLFLAWRHG